MMVTIPKTTGLSIIDPIIHTPVAVLEVLSGAQAFSFLFSAYACLAALELVRSSQGVVLYFARLAFIITALGTAAAYQFGDFLAAPAKAAISFLVASEPPEGHRTAFYSTLGLLTAGVAYQATKMTSRPTRAPFAHRSQRALASSRRLGNAREKQGRMIDLPLGDRQLVRTMFTSRPTKPPQTFKRMQTYQVARSWS